MHLKDYLPECQLIKPNNEVSLPRFSVIEAHGHIELFNTNPPSPEELIDRMDEAGITKFMDLDSGISGPNGLEDRVNRYKGRYPERFNHAAGIEWASCLESRDSIFKIAEAQVRQQHRVGARALKIWKNLGLSIRDAQGNLIMIDDPRLEPIWNVAGELKMPVFLHVGDPIAFFQVPDEHNERFEELQENPDWCFNGPEFADLDRILKGLENVVSRFPDTVFIGCHVGCIAEDLKRVGNLLDSCPNYFIDLSARLNELGRQPYSAHDFIEKYSDRILFGTDTASDPATLRIWYRFLETRDEYFPYSTSAIPDQGRWNIYGIGLADETLKEVYSGNAERLMFQ